MAIIDNNLLLMRIAKDYYIHGLSQQEIANKENLHRSQVSRALKNARKRGFVKIEIVGPKYYENKEIGSVLKSLLDINNVYITSEYSTSDFYCDAAEILEELIPTRKNVGIGWGRTIYQTASKLYYQNENNSINFYALTGTSGTNKAHLQTNSIVNAFSQSFHGTGHFNNFPPYILKERLSTLEKKRYEEMKINWKNLDTIVMSIGGSVIDTPLYCEEFPEHESLKELQNTPHGEMLGYVFTENNNIHSIDQNYLITSIPPIYLKEVPDVICIAKGDEKISSIISAAKQKYINTLIIDTKTAQNIIEILQKDL